MSVSSTPRPGPDDLPDSLPEDAEADVQKDQQGAYTAETPQRRAASDAPEVRRAKDDKS